MRNRIAASIVSLAVAIGTVLATAPSAQAASQGNCSFTVPKPTISSSTGKASWSMKVSCTSLPAMRIDRQVVVDLMADDAVIDDVLKWTVKNTKKAGEYTVSGSGWPCQEDAVGNDEIYLRAHIETKQAVFPNPWVKGSWVNGPVRSGNCW